LRLVKVARKAIEDPSLVSIRPRETGDRHLRDELVGDELPEVHEGLGLPAEAGALGDLSTQHVAGGDVGHIHLLGESLG
jgi:hypothetical protein